MNRPKQKRAIFSITMSPDIVDLMDSRLKKNESRGLFLERLVLEKFGDPVKEHFGRLNRSVAALRDLGYDFELIEKGSPATPSKEPIKKEACI